MYRLLGIDLIWWDNPFMTERLTVWGEVDGLFGGRDSSLHGTHASRPQARPRLIKEETMTIFINSFCRVMGRPETRCPRTNFLGLQVPLMNRPGNTMSLH